MFELKPASIHDLDNFVEIFILATKNDSNWNTLKGSVSEEGHREYLRNWFCPRLNSPNTQPRKIIEATTNRMVAWGMLGLPEPDPTNTTVTSSDTAKKSFPAHLPEGWNIQAQEVMSYEVIPAIYKYGYDPTKHCVRQTMMVHPDFQRQGLGAMLTQHFNMIADELEVETFARARPGAAGLFQKHGYVILEVIQFDVGDLTESGTTPIYVMKRNPEVKRSCSIRGQIVGEDYQ